MTLGRSGKSLLARGRRARSRRFGRFPLCAALLTSILRGMIPRIAPQSIVVGRRIVAGLAIRSRLGHPRVIRAALLIHPAETTIATGLGNNETNFVRIHPATRHVRQEAAFLAHESSQNLHIISNAILEVSRKGTQLSSEAAKFVPRLGEFASDEMTQTKENHLGSIEAGGGRDFPSRRARVRDGLPIPPGC